MILHEAVATLGGLGRAPIAPGTVGAAVALVLPPLVEPSSWAYLVILVAVAAAATRAAGRVVEATRDPDPRRVVADEAAGMLVACAFLPASPERLAWAFLLFRAFDVAKPPPCRALERLPGGLGVVADDLAAGLWANLAVRLLWYAAGGV